MVQQSQSMLRTVLLAALLAILVSSLALKKRTVEPNLRVVRTIPSEFNHYHHDATDVALLGMLVSVGTSPTVDLMIPNLKIDTMQADLLLYVCSETDPRPTAFGSWCYNPSFSSTYVKVSPTYARDTFQATNMDSQTYKIPNVTFLAHPTLYDTMAGGETGSIGFGWPSLQKHQTTYLPYKLLEQVGQKRFSLALGTDLCAGVHLMGQDCSSDEHSLTPDYVPVTAQGYWQFALKGFTFGSVKVPSLQENAVIDTNKGYIGMPKQFLTQMMNAYSIQWDGLYSAYTTDCHNSNLPNFEVAVQGKTVVITPAAYVYTKEPLANGKCIVSFEDSKAFGFGADWYFGTPLLLAQCVTFDFENKQIGFTKNSYKFFVPC